MDPNENLARQEQIVESFTTGQGNSIDVGEAVELAELVDALNKWILSGGFLPRKWDRYRVGRRD